MQTKFEQKILKDFPGLFNPDPTLKNNLMSFGFECDSGWNKIIYNLCKKLKPLVHGIEYFQVMQVKEKYGGLRFYISSGTDEMYKLIEQAEIKSYKTCEICGLPGKLREKGMWLKTLCWWHKIKLGYINLRVHDGVKIE